MIMTKLTVKTGNIIRFNKEGSRKYGYGLVIRTDRTDGYYYIKCDRYGRIEYWLGLDHSAANYINHSNMLLSCIVKVISHLELRNSYGMPSSGIVSIDNYLSLLDGRYTVFRAHAPLEMVELFDKNEDRNCHEDNGLMIARWYEQYLLKQVGAS